MHSIELYILFGQVRLVVCNIQCFSNRILEGTSQLERFVKSVHPMDVPSNATDETHQAQRLLFRLAFCTPARRYLLPRNLAMQYVFLHRTQNLFDCNVAILTIQQPFPSTVNLTTRSSNILHFPMMVRHDHVTITIEVESSSEGSGFCFDERSCCIYSY